MGPPIEAVGPYRLDSLLGRGGMGEVYKAFDQRLGRSVAVKHIRPEDAGDPEARERFQREARIAAQLGHPAIAQVFDVLEQNGDAWIVMELIDGPTLEELLSDGPLDVGLALSYGRQVASALAVAHAKGIVHRDLKSENVMVLPSGHVKILDFGLAKAQLSENGDNSLSMPGHVLGTARCMSPEQARGLEVDGRSDLFSLGVLLYELLSARSPFRARTPQATLERVTTHVIEIGLQYPDGYFKVEGPYSRFLERREAFLAAQAKQELALRNTVRQEIAFLRSNVREQRTKSKHLVGKAYDAIEELGSVTVRNAGAASAAISLAIRIRSTSGGITRAWSGTGSSAIIDVDVKDQAGTAQIIVFNGTDTGNNGSNWTFNDCDSAPTVIIIDWREVY